LLFFLLRSGHAGRNNGQSAKPGIKKKRRTRLMPEIGALRLSSVVRLRAALALGVIVVAERLSRFLRRKLRIVSARHRHRVQPCRLYRSFGVLFSFVGHFGAPPS
jgi:hypothetical protein